MELVFATNNIHKINEIRSLLSDSFKILSLAEIGFTGEIPEDSSTLEGNASQKAWFIRNKFGIDCFADDTGLEVDALNGEPGVYSARYAGAGRSFGDNMTKLLEKMSEINHRNARFRTVISLVTGDQEIQFEGVVRGEILRERRGIQGFGYDPVFRPEGCELTFAEMDLEQKNKISHRGRAFNQMVSYLLRFRDDNADRKV